MRSYHQEKLVTINPAKWHLHHMVAQIFCRGFHIPDMIHPAGFEICHCLFQGLIFNILWLKAGKSLLPIGVVAAEGEFERGAAVACIDPDGREVARGLSNYGSGEARLIARKSTAAIEKLLGYVDEPEIIHRDNLILLA